MFLLLKRVDRKAQGCRATYSRPSEKTNGPDEATVVTVFFSPSTATELSCSCVSVTLHKNILPGPRVFRCNYTRDIALTIAPKFRLLKSCTLSTRNF